VIEVENLSKHYEDHIAVNHISFQAQEGEILGLLGPNGAGKTSTMRMLTAFMPPTSGRAVVAGFDVVEDSFAVRKCVGYMPERVPLYPDMTVREYVLFWARLREAAKPAQQTDAALARVNLTDRKNMLVRNLSKGLKQRLGLAQTLVHNPSVVILDEPTIGIDPQQVIEVRQNVRALAREHTVLFSTHILSEAEQVCDRVVILNKGQIVAVGKPSDLRQQLQRGEHVYVQVANIAAAQLAADLRTVAGVAAVEISGDGVIVRGEQTRVAVSQHITQHGGVLLELRPVAMTLEDIFLDLVAKDNAQAKGS
jgi:ABC-2 type transport system ATP-binding protein